MIPEIRRLCIGMALLLFLCTPLALRAQLSKQDQETAKSMIAGTLYLRLHAPCKYGTGQWGTGLGSVLEVSPTAHDTQRKLSFPTTSGRESLYWGFFPNQAVHEGSLSYDGDTVMVWMEGVKPDNNEIQIDFIHIKSIDDFTKAFNQTFSKVPLQDEHQEWPAEVRTAIAERKVVVGMTKEQAYDVVGDPLDIQFQEANGVKVEIWHPRQDRGRALRARRGAYDGHGPTGFPTQLKFVDGKLQVIG
jgi:hypothetical protein